MSRIEQTDKIRRSIERGDPQPTVVEKLAAEDVRQRQLNEQYKAIGEHGIDCSCYFCGPQI